MTLRGWLVALAVTVVSPVSAADQVIVCTITHTYDFTTEETSPTTGEDVFEVTTNPDGSSNYALPFGCETGVKVDISATAMMFDCLQDIGGTTYQRFVKIDRVTGEYQATFSRPGANGLLHVGRCRVRLF